MFHREQREQITCRSLNGDSRLGLDHRTADISPRAGSARPAGRSLLSLVLLGPGIYFEIDAALAAAAGPT